MLAPSPVRHVAVVDIGPTYITLTWREPIDKNGKVIYRVFYNLLYDSDGDIFSAYTEFTNVNVSGLHEYETYRIGIQPYTEHGGNGTISYIENATDATCEYYELFKRMYNN